MAKRFVSIVKRLRKSYQKGRVKRGKPPLRPACGKVDKELMDISTRIYQNYQESWERLKKDTKNVLMGKYPVRGIDRHGHIVEQRPIRTFRKRKK